MRLRLALLVLAGALLLETFVGDVASLPALLGAFAVGYYGTPPVILLAGAIAAAGMTAGAGHTQYSAANDFVWYAVAVIGTPAVLGRLLALRRARTYALRARAARLEADRDRRASISELEERLRLNAELQVALGERVRLIADRAATADQGALAAIETAARAALADIRDVLGWLRYTPAATLDHPQGCLAPNWNGSRKVPGTLVGLDAAIAVALGIAFAAEVVDAAYRRGGVLLNGALIAVTVLPLVWRRRAPAPASLAALVGMLVMSVAATPLTPLVTPVVLLVLLPYTLGAHLALRSSVLMNTLAVTLAGAGQLLTPAAARHDSSLGALLVVEFAAWGAGRWVRVHDHGVASATDRATALGAERDDAARLAALAERARVARELHDVTAHTMTAIVLQAGAAQRVWDTDRVAAKGALAAVGRLAGEALETLRESMPSGGHADLDALASHARANGLTVTLEGAAPPGLADVAYRTVQEALTNAARHASGAVVDVRLRSQEHQLVVEVVDDGGRSADLEGSGHGLRGMRERVEAAGGRLETGPRPEGGFAVRATLPL